MKKSGKLMLTAVSFAAFLGTSAFADSRHFETTQSRRDGYRASYDRDYLRGVVQRVDRRRDLITVRDLNSGRFITVDANRLDNRGRRLGADDLRRGDAITLAGNWTRGNIFLASRIESVNSRKW